MTPEVSQQGAHGHVTLEVSHVVPGHVVTSSRGHVVTWSRGHVVAWSRGHVIPWSRDIARAESGDA
eukprot:686447-Amorphochlora_amoeboformis.AAC.1